jgi:hypothetical protein
MPNYIYAQKDDKIYINLFVPSSTTFDIENKKIEITQKSDMPWNGNISLTVEPEKPVKSSLFIRIPGWASENPVPGNLYSFLEKPSSKPVFKVNGEEVNPKFENGYAVISKTWQPGDWVEIGFPFEIRKIKANEKIEDDRGKMALQLGPLVYCAEWPDYSDPDILSLILPENTSLTAEFQPALLGGINVISGNAEGAEKVEGSAEIKTTTRKFTAIPYYSWAHRGQGQMAVWIPTTKESTRPKPFPTIASKSKIEASYETDLITGINDQLLPKNSADKTNTLYHWWPKKDEMHWIIYNFEKPTQVSETEVYWLKDIPSGGCDLPEDWKLFYKSGEKWIPVNAETPYPIIEDELNKLVFEPVTTTALKMEVRLQKHYSAGLHEWIVR